MGKWHSVLRYENVIAGKREIEGKKGVREQWLIGKWYIGRQESEEKGTYNGGGEHKEEANNG